MKIMVNSCYKSLYQYCMQKDVSFVVATFSYYLMKTINFDSLLNNFNETNIISIFMQIDVAD